MAMSNNRAPPTSTNPNPTARLRQQTRMQMLTASGAQTNLFQVCRNVLRDEGVAGFYRGVMPPLLGVGGAVKRRRGLTPPAQSSTPAPSLPSQPSTPCCLAAMA